MTFHEFLNLFLILVLIGSVTVTGWYKSTRGEKETLPDGSIKKTGMIFKEWYFFWTKTKGVKKVYYLNNRLYWLYLDYLSYYPNNEYGLQYENSDNETGQHSTGSLKFKSEIFASKFEKDIEKIKTDLQVEVLLKGEYVSFYKEYDEYVYPEWIRKPLAECATCFASVYGALFYWPLLAMVQGSIFNWATYPVMAALFFWIVFTFCLAVINTFIAKNI